MPSKVIIIDYGSQVTQLIARRVREAGVYSEIHPCVVTAAQVKAMQPSAIILSGGPASVGEKDAPALDKGFLDLGVPVLGICYGMQLLAFTRWWVGTVRNPRVWPRRLAVCPFLRPVGRH